MLLLIRVLVRAGSPSPPAPQLDPGHAGMTKAPPPPLALPPSSCEHGQWVGVVPEEFPRFQ